MSFRIVRGYHLCRYNVFGHHHTIDAIVATFVIIMYVLVDINVSHLPDHQEINSERGRESVYKQPENFFHKNFFFDKLQL